MPKPAFMCVGFTPKEVGLSVNCANCEAWVNSKCRDRQMLDELYMESPKGYAFDRMMRSKQGISITE